MWIGMAAQLVEYKGWDDFLRRWPTGDREKISEDLLKRAGGAPQAGRKTAGRLQRRTTTARSESDLAEARRRGPGN